MGQPAAPRTRWGLGGQPDPASPCWLLLCSPQQGTFHFLIIFTLFLFFCFGGIPGNTRKSLLVGSGPYGKPRIEQTWVSLSKGEHPSRCAIVPPSPLFFKLKFLMLECWFFLHCPQENGASLILRDIARARENIQKSLAGVSTWWCCRLHTWAPSDPRALSGLCVPEHSPAPPHPAVKPVSFSPAEPVPAPSPLSAQGCLTGGLCSSCLPVWKLGPGI